MYKILAVDDEPDALRILQFHLEDAGYSVVTATNGQEALEVLKKNPDSELILLDNMMPKMDGIEVLRQIKGKDSHFMHIPVIMQTAKAHDYDAYEGIDAGALQYITKPYSREMLLAAVETVLRDVNAIKAKYSRKH